MILVLGSFVPAVSAQYTVDGQYCSQQMKNNPLIGCGYPAPGGIDTPPGQTTNGNQNQQTTNGNQNQQTTNGNQNQNGPVSTYQINLPNPLKNGTNNLLDFIKVVVNNVLLPIGGVVATMYIIYSGFLFVTAQGDPKKIETAKAAFTYAVIGTAILLGAWAISEGIAATINQIVR